MSAPTRINRQPPTETADVRSAAPLGRAEGDEILAQIEQHAPWSVWAEKLAGRKKPLPLKKLLPAGKTSPLAWSWSPATGDETASLIRQLETLKKRPSRSEPTDWAGLVVPWLQQASSPTLDLDFGLQCLAWAHALPRLAPRLSAEQWWDLLAVLLNTCSEAIAGFTVPEMETAASDLVTAQLVTGELPLTLSYTFPRLDRCRELAPAARHCWAESLVALSDGEGMLHGQLLPWLRPLLASWTRSMYLDRALSGKKLAKEARWQYEWLVRQVLRIRRADGSFAFEPPAFHPEAARDLLQAAVALAGDAVDCQLLAQLTGRKPTDTDYQLPEPAEHSEWAAWAVLRSKWKRGANVLTVDHSRPQLPLELTQGNHLLWSGPSLPQIQIDGRTATSQSEWEELCWYTDKDVDYLELETEYGSGWRLQRQFLLAREDDLLLLADALVGPSAAELAYELQLPAALGQVSDHDETHDSQIRFHQKPVGRILPLTLSEWRSDPRAGQFRQGRLQQRGDGRGLYAAVLVDLNPRRVERPLTWRQLTVAEQLQIQPADTAVAYRVQIGREQWIVYRSLARPGNRTFLGQNLISEFLVGRFNTQGEVETLVEIE